MDQLKLAFVLVFVLLKLSPQGQSLTFVTWEGRNISGPSFIYHHQIAVEGAINVSGSLVCRGDAPVNWHFANNNSILPESGSNYVQRRNSQTDMATMVRSTESAAAISGLWPCRSDERFEGASFVGLYQDGEGIVTIENISIGSSSSFSSNPPNFTLFGYTSGGSPINYTWTRDGVPITNGGPFSISIDINRHPSAGRHILLNSTYQSTLNVTGRMPGVYRYSVSNPATDPEVTLEFAIEGNSPSDLAARQIGVNLVEVSWTAPSPPPSRGYRITVDSSDISTGMDTTSTALNITASPGVYMIRLVALSQHFPSEIVGPVNITVLALRIPVDIQSRSLTATSVFISWTQPEDSLPADEYRIALIRTPGQILCQDNEDNIRNVTSTTMSATLTDLQEFSLYSITVSAVALGQAGESSLPINITTPEASPTQPPQDVTITTTSQNISVTWSNITCIERNGEITGYAVEFGLSGGETDSIMIMQNDTVSLFSFNRDGLTPFTDYTFRVAGVNSAGIGVYSNLSTIRTDEDVPGPVSALFNNSNFGSIVLTWSPPQEPNGIIISYKVTYTVNDTNPVTINITALSTTLTIPSLTPKTRVSATVSAYTSVGEGKITHLPLLVTLSNPPLVTNIEVEILSDSLVRVSWDRLPVSELTGYRVYYSQTGNRKRQQRSEQSVTLSHSENSVVISGLVSNKEYQYQVVAIAEVDGSVLIGPRSTTVTTKLASSETACRVGSSIAASIIVTFLLTVLVYTSVLLLAWLRLYRKRGITAKKIQMILSCCQPGNAERKTITGEEGIQEDSYESMQIKTLGKEGNVQEDTYEVFGESMQMKVCTAYKNVLSKMTPGKEGSVPEDTYEVCGESMQMDVCTTGGKKPSKTPGGKEGSGPEDTYELCGESMKSNMYTACKNVPLKTPEKEECQEEVKKEVDKEDYDENQPGVELVYDCIN